MNTAGLGAVRDFLVETADYSAALSWRDPISATHCRPTQYTVDVLALSADSLIDRRSITIDTVLLNVIGDTVRWRLSALQAATLYRVSLSAVDGSAGLVGDTVQTVFKTKPASMRACLLSFNGICISPLLQSVYM